MAVALTPGQAPEGEPPPVALSNLDHFREAVAVYIRITEEAGYLCIDT